MKMLTYDDLQDYQRYAIATGVNLEQAGLILGTGLGKTIIGLAIVDQLMKRGLVKNTLIVSTKKVVYNTYRQEAQKWEPVQDLTFSIIHGNEYSGSSEKSKRFGFHANTDIKLINYEGLPWLAEYMHSKKYTHQKYEFPFQCIIYDESTKMKHPNTQRFRVWKKIMRMFKYRYIGTGTFIPNGLLDAFGQMYVMDLGESLGTVFKNYKDRYFMTTGPPGPDCRLVLLRTARESIQKRLKKRLIYMKKEDYVKLPPIHYNPIELDLPEKIRPQYDELEQTFFIELDEARIEAFAAASLSMKLRQFLQGKMYYYDEEDVRHTASVHNEKLEYVKELVDTSNGKTKILSGDGNCIIAYNFQFEREDLLSIFPDAPVIDGSAKDKDVTKAIKEWNQGEHSILLFNPASDPHGLNLQFGGNQILWYSLTWNLEHYIQLIDRLYRQLQDKHVFVHHILFRGTVDEVIFRALTAKERTQSLVLSALKQYKQTATGGSQERS